MRRSKHPTFLSYSLALMLLFHGHEVLGLAASSRYGKSVITDQTAGTIEELLPCVETVNLGQDKLVNILVPPDELNRQKRSGMKGSTVSTSNGTGDVVWPSSFALARLVAHRPSIVKNRRVMELGCGLGLVSAAACKYARPEHVAITDCDINVLRMAYKSCTQLNRARGSVSRSSLDWKDPISWPKQRYDTILASDVLYEKASILSFVRVLEHFLSDDDDVDFQKMAIIVDPVRQVNRDAFSYAAHRSGLEVEMEPFPGMDDFVLLKVTSS